MRQRNKALCLTRFDIMMPRTHWSANQAKWLLRKTVKFVDCYGEKHRLSASGHHHPPQTRILSVHWGNWCFFGGWTSKGLSRPRLDRRSRISRTSENGRFQSNGQSPIYSNTSLVPAILLFAFFFSPPCGCANLLADLALDLPFCHPKTMT